MLIFHVLVSEKKIKTLKTARAAPAMVEFKAPAYMDMDRTGEGVPTLTMENGP